jgi:hypothetical protein
MAEAIAMLKKIIQPFVPGAVLHTKIGIVTAIICR